MKKGISPLIAAVVLIAFVISVASIASTFFTDIAKEWTGQVGSEDPIDCSVAQVDIAEDTWTSNTSQGKANITVYIGQTKLSELGLTVQDEFGNTEYTGHTPGDYDDVEGDYFKSGRSYRLTDNDIPSGTIEKLTLTTPDCPAEDTVEF